MEPTGRRVEMGGDATWVEATTSKSDFRSTCYASASSTRGIPLPHFPPAALTVRVSLTHNSRALFMSLSHSPVIYVDRRPRFSVPSTLAYFTQSVHTTEYSFSPSLLLSISSYLSTNLISLKVRYKLSLRRGVNSLKCFAIEYS